MNSVLRLGCMRYRGTLFGLQDEHIPLFVEWLKPSFEQCVVRQDLLLIELQGTSARKYVIDVKLRNDFVQIA